jgi:hypothetical protein
MRSHTVIAVLMHMLFAYLQLLLLFLSMLLLALMQLTGTTATHYEALYYTKSALLTASFLSADIQVPVPPVSRDVDWNSKGSTAATAKAEESFQQSIGRFAPASSSLSSSLNSSTGSSSQQQQKPLLLQGFVPATSDQQRAAAASGSGVSGSVEDDAPPLDVELAKKPPIDLFKSIFEVGETDKLSLCVLLVLAYTAMVCAQVPLEMLPVDMSLTSANKLDTRNSTVMHKELQ